MANSFLILTKKELIYLIVLFILGIITGAVILNIYICQTIDQLILEKKELTAKVEEQQKQISQLEEHKQRYINKITVFLKTDVNKHTQQEIKNTIQNILSGFYGKETNQIDPLLLWDIINQRYIPIGSNYYRLQVLFSAIIADELQLYIKVETTKKNQEPE